MSQQAPGKRADSDPPALTDQQRTALTSLIRRVREYVNSLSQDLTDLDIYLVGGSNRDALLDEQGQDYDFVVPDETVDSMLSRGFIDINASSFGVLHDSNHEEWALTRTETKPDDEYGYKSIKVNTDDVTLREDLARRDLCMNAIALRLFDGVPDTFDETEAVAMSVDGVEAALIDPFNGRGDIAAGRIRHVTDAFREDPIRVLRAARYAARFETTPDVPDQLRDDVPDTVPFTVAPETERLMRELAPELNRMSRDRVGEEIVKAMKQAQNPTRFWDVLRDAGALAVIAPHLDRATIVPAGPKQFHREGNTYTHTMMVVEQMHQLCESKDISGVDRARRLLMAVAHDLGKVTVADKKGGLWSDDPPRRFGGHAQTGVADADTLATRLGLDPHFGEAMQDAAEHHMNIHDLPIWGPEHLVEFVDTHDAPASADTPYMATIDELVDVAQADHQGRFQTRDAKDISGPDDFTQDADAPEDAVRPVFDREVFDSRIETARTAIATISGYEVLRDALCDSHTPDDINDNDLAGVLGACEDCRTPGAWVGEEITARRNAFITGNTE